MQNQIIKIDGSFGSGGGQIVRTACALSAISQKPCSIFNIRARRPKPGLASQHLLAVQALAQLCQAKLEGNNLDSKDIKFYPSLKEFAPQKLNIKIETAASLTLILQSLILPALFLAKPVKFSFEGGASDTFFSPTIDYFRYVFLKILEKIGLKTEINILKRGYYPEGKARIEATIFPSRLKNFNLLERGQLKKISVISGAANSLKEKKVAERQIAGTREVLGKLKLPLEEKIEYYETACPGSQICLIADFENTTIGTDNLGKLGKRAEDVGKEAALNLLKEERSKACLDKYLADQILPFLALSKSKSSVTVSEITDHCKTNIWVIEKFLKGNFIIKENIITWLANK